MTAAVDATTVATRSRRGVVVRIASLVGALVLLTAAIAASMFVGARDVPPDLVVHILLGGDASVQDTDAVLGLRLPRTIAAVLVGAALGVAGALIQALTRNPLADPGLLGVTSGSSFAVAMGVALFGITSPAQYVWIALIGAGIATTLVMAIGSVGRGGGDPVRIVLAGVAIGAVLAGIVAGLRLSNPRTFSVLQVWESGRLDNRGWDVLLPILPILCVGLVLALVLSPALDVLALGDDLASSLGARVGIVRTGTVIAVSILAGSATAVAGPLAFLGLMVPHVGRFLAGPRNGWIVILSALIAPVILIVSDMLARVALTNGELPVGVVLAFVGAPVLIVLARRRLGGRS
ncbi:FecCD family ABC transporter permease [Agrococcus jejuensis]|uniref:Iron complex transport system permease protein n=1 Tax=Agrococcus jejuensis TaxID=399736 RepID=A0A1G8DTT6_9MICO|nr:iron chelate uptake ABC transporter family permease subunit [Agrococcus jejuensis]SDH61092.1 iron complex transport system permease protein [Agrococcus jejuensis]